MTDIKPSKLNLPQLYLDGQRRLQSARAADEVQKQGTLRAGNTGVMDDQESIHGSCVRQTWLRSEGVETEIPDDKLLMFTTGFANEDDWVAKLKESWHGKILQEEETPISWTTDHGYTVTGRPDIVLCGSDGSPTCVLELKSIQSFWTVRSVILKNEPRIAHLAQACHYMWQLGVPGMLIYTNQTNRLIPWKYKEEFADTRYQDERGMNVIPFHYQYTLDIEDGVLYYTTEAGERVQTIITVDGIKRFYEAVGKMAQTKTLPGRPTTADATGGTAYSPCKYCEFAPVCDQYEDRSFEDWYDHAMLKSRGHDI